MQTFSYEAQVAMVLGALTVTVLDAPDTRSPKAQLRTWLGALPEVMQPALAVRHLRPAPLPAGSVSVSFTFMATPDPVLFTLSLHDALPISLMVWPSGVLVTCSCGFRQMICPGSLASAALV